jgi:hypothetical protein
MNNKLHSPVSKNIHKMNFYFSRNDHFLPARIMIEI